MQVGQVSAIPSDVGIDVVWKIDHFASLSATDGSWYFSPTFKWKGHAWLKIYPNGWTKEDSFGHIDLNFYTWASDSTTFDMFVSIKAANGEKVMERHVTSVFEENFYGCNYLFRRFISRSELMRRKSELLPSGVLTILITFKKQLADRRESGACASITPTYPLHYKLLQDFKQLFDSKEDTDVILNVQGVEFPAHRNILKARSPVLAANFRHDMRENASGVIDIDDCSSSCFSDFLSFLYCGEVINKFSHENVFHLFKVADKYEVLDLRSKCLEYLKKNINVESFCDTISLAFRHFESDLINLATHFFIKNAEEILVTVQWQKFAAENLTQSNELFLKYVKSVKSPKE